MDITATPADRFERINKIIDYSVALLFVLFIVFLLMPYYSYNQGDVIQVANGSTVTVTDSDSFSLLGYCGFPSEHKLISQIYKAMDVRTISVKQIGMVLFLAVFDLIGLYFIFFKKGLPKAIYTSVWGVIGLIGFALNYFLIYGNTYVKPVLLAIVIVVTVISIVNSILYALDVKARYAYLKSVSAAYR